MGGLTRSGVGYAQGLDVRACLGCFKAPIAELTNAIETYNVIGQRQDELSNPIEKPSGQRIETELQRERVGHRFGGQRERVVIHRQAVRNVCILPHVVRWRRKQR